MDHWSVYFVNAGDVARCAFANVLLCCRHCVADIACGKKKRYTQLPCYTIASVIMLRTGDAVVEEHVLAKYIVCTLH